MNLPNLITFGRLLSVPVAVYMIMQSAHLAAFILFVLAGISDALDGYLAKHNDQTTLLGFMQDRDPTPAEEQTGPKCQW